MYHDTTGKWPKGCPGMRGGGGVGGGVNKRGVPHKTHSTHSGVT